MPGLLVAEEFLVHPSGGTATSRLRIDLYVHLSHDLCGPIKYFVLVTLEPNFLEGFQGLIKSTLQIDS